MVFKMRLLKNKHSPTVMKLLKDGAISAEYMDYQFIQRSIVPSLHFQSALPRLPVPELEATCRRYLAAQRPLLADDVYKKVETNVRLFQHGAGQQLQNTLKHYNKANKHTSYISEMWFDKYLKTRTSLPVNCNAMLVLNDDHRPDYNDQLIRATNMIISSARFYRALKEHLLEPEIYHMNPKKSDTQQFRKLISLMPPKLAYLAAYFYKAFPLDMKQYPNLFGTTRIPDIGKDHLYSKEGSKHITVQHKGNIYTVDVLSENGDVLSPLNILQNIKHIKTSQTPRAEYPVGVLTTLERNRWATIRQNLNQCNEQVLNIIDSALFNVCLDTDNVEKDPYKIVRKFIHDDGTNRWFDKSYSLIISGDGVTGVNFEHSWGDGVAVLRYSQDIYKDTVNNPMVSPSCLSTVKDSPVTVRLLEFNLNDELKNSIIEAKNEFKVFCDSLDINYIIYEDLHKGTCKTSNVSPDAVMQIAFQMAYNKLLGSFGSTYESCSTAAFKHGRTETIRPLSLLVKNLCLANNSTHPPPLGELKELLIKCSHHHNRLIKEAAMGQGFDRHLFALKHFADINNIKCSIFDDSEYSNINYNRMSTSTLNSPVIQAGGFGPEVKDGFGIGYAVKDKTAEVLVTSYKGKQNGRDFIEALRKSFEDIYNILG